MQLPPSTKVSQSTPSISPTIRSIILLAVIIPIGAFLLFAGFFFIAILVAVFLAIAMVIHFARFIRHSFTSTSLGTDPRRPSPMEPNSHDSNFDRTSIPKRDTEGRENVRVIRPN